jgi:hypothetical protein
MIISHAHKFIFLRTEKTASTSLAHALLTLLEPGDEWFGSGASAAAHPGIRAAPRAKGWKRRTFPRLFGLHFHASARDVRSVVGRKVFDTYFKFAVERNPWDRQVSLYMHRSRQRGGDGTGFSRDMSSPFYRMMHHTRLANWQVYTIGDSVVADWVIRYDELSGSLPALAERAGLPAVPQMNSLRAGYRDRGTHYSAHYTPAVRDLVARWYRPEIEAFGFQFETPSAQMD